MTMAGQTINDRLLAARHSLAGQGLAKSVCKATTEECIGPKKKHLDCKCNAKRRKPTKLRLNMQTKANKVWKLTVSWRRYAWYMHEQICRLVKYFAIH